MKSLFHSSFLLGTLLLNCIAVIVFSKAVLAERVLTKLHTKVSLKLAPVRPKKAAHGDVCVYLCSGGFITLILEVDINQPVHLLLVPALRGLHPAVDHGPVRQHGSETFVFQGDGDLREGLSQFLQENVYIGLGFGNRVGLLGTELIALGVYAFQILFSTLWMRPFTYGPVEWVWRMLSYGKRLPLKRQ